MQRLAALFLLVALAVPFAPAASSGQNEYPNCPGYGLLDVYEAGAGIKMDGYGRFVLRVNALLFDYVVWDEPSGYAFGGQILGYFLYAETNGVEDLQRHDWNCQEVDWWDSDTYVW